MDLLVSEDKLSQQLLGRPKHVEKQWFCWKEWCHQRCYISGAGAKQEGSERRLCAGRPALTLRGPRPSVGASL